MVAEDNVGRTLNNVWVGYSFLGPWKKVCQNKDIFSNVLDDYKNDLVDRVMIAFCWVKTPPKPYKNHIIFSYPDLAISDYESDVVYLFKTKPTIRVQAWFPDLKTDTPIGGPEGGIQRYFGCGNEKCWKLCLRYEGVDHTGSSLSDLFKFFM